MIVFLLIFNAGSSGAHRAAGVFVSRQGPIGNGRPPDMPFRADPPDLPIASGRDHLRCQCAIEHRMPLGRYFRCYGGQIIESRKNFLTATIGAFRHSSHPLNNFGSPFMPSRTLPCCFLSSHPPAVDRHFSTDAIEQPNGACRSSNHFPQDLIVDWHKPDNQ